MVLQSDGVRMNFRMDIDLPILSPAGLRRFKRSVRRRAVRESRKRIATPSRRGAPRLTGELRRSIRSSGRYSRNRYGSRNFRGRDTFVVMSFKFRFYFYYQTEAWHRFRSNVDAEAPAIIMEAVRAALREEGFSR